jgi:hypothetical protein
MRLAFVKGVMTVVYIYILAASTSRQLKISRVANVVITPAPFFVIFS